MKVQIIQLEAHDDTISTRDKMGWSQTGRILLVWPPRGRILNRKLDLVLLQRYSKTQGAKLALVTNDPEVIYNADQLGLPVFEDVRQALDSRWRGKRTRLVRITHKQLPVDLEALRNQTKQPPGKWMESPAVRLGSFILSIGAILAIVSIFIPSATLILSPSRKTQEIKMTVVASPEISDVNIAGEIPTHRMTVIVEGTDSITTTGSIRIPDKYAIGGVRFTNLTEEKITIPEGTIVSTLDSVPIRFTTTKSGELPAGIGKNIVLPTKATLPGESGNVPAESLLAVEGALGLKIAVVNPVRTHNGGDQLVPAASQEDQSGLYNQLVLTLKQTALEEFKQKLNEGDTLVDDTLELSDMIEKIYDPPLGQPANQVELTLRLQFDILTIKISDIHALANLVLDANLPNRYQPLQETLVIQQNTLPKQGTDGSLELQITIRRDTVAIIDEPQAINLILGLNTNQANQRLSDSFDLRKTPDISLIPKWWPKLPYIPFRVQVSQLVAP